MVVVVSDNRLGWWFLVPVTGWIVDCWLLAVVLVLCGSILLVFPCRCMHRQKPLSGGMMVEWWSPLCCYKCCSWWSVDSTVALYGVLCQVLSEQKLNLHCCSWWSVVTGWVIFQELLSVERCSKRKDELSSDSLLILSECVWNEVLWSIVLDVLPFDVIDFVSCRLM